MPEGGPAGLLVLGNAGLDLGLLVPRLPRPGETLMGGGRHGAPGGKGLNQAVAAARASRAVGLGLVRLLAPLGEDAEAGIVEAALRAEGLAELRLPRLPGATDLSVLLVTPDGENSIVSCGGCAAALPPERAAAAAAGLVPGEWLLMQGNLSATATAAALAVASDRGAPIMLNAAPLWWDVRPLLGHLAVVVANADEARELTGESGGAAARALHAAGARLAVVTLGAEGCAVADRDGVRHLPAAPARAVDSTGAGDAFCGVLAALLAAGRAPDAALAAAGRAAARCVERPGAFAALPEVAELRALLACP